MGGVFSAAWNEPGKALPTKFEVDHRNPPTFDANLGFSNVRKERKFPLSYEELVDAQVPMEFRDFCAHKYVEIEKCKRQYSMVKNAFMQPCGHLDHEYHDCMHEDHVIRFKEYEREKRLLQRQKRRIEQGLAKAPEANAA